jgi:acyl-CoA thioesterase-1
MVLTALCLIIGSADAAKKKPNQKPKGKAKGPAVSAKAQPLLKQAKFAIDGKVGKTVNNTFYLDPEQKYRPTKIWGLDLPNTISGVPITGLVGRRMKVSFSGSASAKSGNQIKFEPKRFTAVKPLDGKPLPKAKQAGTKKNPGAKKNTGKKPAGSGPAVVATPIADFDRKLPNVLLLGDAVSISYTSSITRLLAGQANVTRPLRGKSAESCRGTDHGRENLQRWLGKTKWDVIHFNFGLDDLKQQATPETYAKNLEIIAKKLKATGAHLIFSNTTPTPEKKVIVYNAKAAKVMEKLDIEVNDMHAFVKPRVAELQLANKIQFKKVGSAKLAARVTSKIRSALGIKAKKAS